MCYQGDMLSRSFKTLSKPLLVLLTLILISPTTTQAACLIRDYSEEHLSAQPQQELRHLSFSVNIEQGIQYTEENVKAPFEARRYYYPFALNIESKRNNEALFLEASGVCDTGFWAGRIWQDQKCWINNGKDGEERWEEFAIKPYEKPGANPEHAWTLARFSDSNTFQIKGTNKRTKLVSNDYSVALVETQSRLTDGDGSDASFPRGCPSGFMDRGLSKSFSRSWNEVALDLVRLSLARPTVTARNLFHLSQLMQDAHASFDARPAHVSKVTTSLEPTQANKDALLSYAAFYFLSQRYNAEPGNDNFASEYSDYVKVGDIDWILQRMMNLWDLSLTPTEEESSVDHIQAHAAGKQLAEQYLASLKNDGSREETNYDPDPNFELINKNEGVHINISGLASPAPVDPTNSFLYFWSLGAKNLASTMNINFWNPLYVPGAMDQNGNSQVSTQSPLTLHWGRVPTFGDLRDHYDSSKGIYFDPGASLPKFESGDRLASSELVQANLDVSRKSLLLNPLKAGDYTLWNGDVITVEEDFPGSMRIDISPISMGNSTLGTNDGTGYGTTTKDPVSGQIYSYEPNLVRAADFYRSIAEFWADGPASETPPGHWNTLANYVLDRMAELKIPYRWMGTGPELSKEEYEQRLYMTLNGALHDAAVVAWGIKGHYQGGRPLTVIRKLADMAQKDTAFAEELVASADGLLKMDDAEFEVHLFDLWEDEDEIPCDQSLLTQRNEDDYFNSSFERQWLLKKKNAGVDVQIAYEEGDPDGESKPCVARYSERKLWIQSWRSTYLRGFSGDGARLWRPEYKTQKEEDLAQVFNVQRLSGTGWILAENWMTYQRMSFVTPPFPGFVSGHSTFSRAAAEVLAGVTGTPFFPGGLGTYKSPHLEFEPRTSEDFVFTWATYFDASDQSGLSRIYGGIHASYDDLPARKIGAKVGQKALKQAQKIFENR